MSRGLRGFAGALAVILCLSGSAVSLAVSPSGLQSRREDKWVLGEYGGYVAVFAPGDGLLPGRVTDVQVRLLPEKDRTQLSQGIVVADRRELMMLLEDFSS